MALGNLHGLGRNIALIMAGCLRLLLRRLRRNHLRRLWSRGLRGTVAWSCRRLGACGVALVALVALIAIRRVSVAKRDDATLARGDGAGGGSHAGPGGGGESQAEGVFTECGLYQGTALFGSGGEVELAFGADVSRLDSH